MTKYKYNLITKTLITVDKTMFWGMADSERMYRSSRNREYFQVYV